MNYLNIFDNLNNKNHIVALTSVEKILSLMPGHTDEFAADLNKFAEDHVIGCYKTVLLTGSPKFKCFKLSEFGTRYFVISQLI